MKRLILWNLLLAACATAGIYQLRRQWFETRDQQQAVLLRKPIPLKTEAAPIPAKPSPFPATTYGDVAQKSLFAKDRNPNVEVVAPPPPPPPPPMPPLPKVYGVMGLPSGLVAMMSDKAGSPQKRVRVGDSIGEFKVVKLDLQKITLQWTDKTIEKSIDELLDHTVVASSAPEPAKQTTPGPGAAVAPASQSNPAPDPKMGIEIGDASHSIRACKQDDTSPAGTELAGYKKVKELTPFGEACRWLPK